MTEAEWLSCADPRRMLDYLQGKTSDRKLRLFACACCRLKWDTLTDEASRAAVVIAEKFADGSITRQALKKARRAAWDRWRYPMLLSAWHAADLWAWQGECATAESIAPRLGPERDELGMKSQCDLLRDVIGDPFGPRHTDPSWLSHTVVTLARTIYTDRAFDRLPILADALQDAGCDGEQLLAHCRSEGPHVRGCWAVDLVLGKT